MKRTDTFVKHLEPSKQSVKRRESRHLEAGDRQAAKAALARAKLREHGGKTPLPDEDEMD